MEDTAYMTVLTVSLSLFNTLDVDSKHCHGVSDYTSRKHHQCESGSCSHSCWSWQSSDSSALQPSFSIFGGTMDCTCVDKFSGLLEACDRNKLEVSLVEHEACGHTTLIAACDKVGW